MPEYTGKTDFVHLHCHTLFSFLDGVSSPAQLFGACKERHWPAIAVTDHGNMAAVPDCWLAAKENKVNYLAGCEIYYNQYEPLRQEMAAKTDGKSIRSLKTTDPELYEKITRNRHLTVIAKNEIGFKNLVTITTEAYDAYYYKPRIWFDKLAQHGEGLIILSGCLNGPVSHALRHNRLNEAVDYIKKFSERWGEDYYIEMQMPCLQDFDDTVVFGALNILAQRYGINRCMTCDAHYLDRRSFHIQKLMMAIDQDTTVDDPNLFHVNSDEQYLKTRAELYETFKTKKYSQYATDADFEIMCDNTLAIASKCKNYEPDTTLKIPTFPDADKRLKLRVAQELIKRGLDKCDEKFFVDNRWVTYTEQAKLEVNRFTDKGFASYFQITEDITEYNIKNGWPVGPRGSVGGSFVCYLLGIVSINPMLFPGLSFDRFLSPTRGGSILNIKLE